MKDKELPEHIKKFEVRETSVILTLDSDSIEVTTLLAIMRYAEKYEYHDIVLHYNGKLLLTIVKDY